MNSSFKKETFSSNQTDDSSQRSWAEPSPHWLEAIKEWNWLWEVHIYGFGTIFVLIAFFALFYLVVSRKTAFTRHGVHLAVMNIALFTSGFFRSLILFWDPYASSSDTTDLQLLICIISWGISTACITSSFSIMLLIFLETTRTSLGPARLKNLPCLVSITLVHILYLLVSDLVVWFHREAKVMIFVCHVTFAVWGLAVSIGYSIAGIRMWRNLKSSLAMGKMFYNRALGRESRRLKRLFVLMCWASCFGVIKFSLSLYTAIGEYGVFADIGYVKSWPWFAVQSSLRTLESLMCVFIFIIAFNNRKMNNNITADIYLPEVGRIQQSLNQVKLNQVRDLQETELS
ncbi:hypothetical protein OS493_015722 [Desmophyllum pertusum]|uniref:Proline-rich transmembrane protein 3/4 domain-containing protein n=1 Tax=Desmophyllum pertusum TaxID=174260 RepID=A0A9W9YPJ2_9CNID|nr:hypothetical protein OS493_015722 [Desmophyllum pertusum]